MSVQIKAHIEENGIGGWLIRVTDTHTSTEIICNNLEEFSDQIEFIGIPYNNELQVVWSKADNLTEEHFYEVKQEIARINKELHQND